MSVIKSPHTGNEHKQCHPICQNMPRLSVFILSSTTKQKHQKERLHTS